MTGYQSKKAAAQAKTIDQVNWADHEPSGFVESKLNPIRRPKVLFPTMLRKMWSGAEVQAWLDENVNKENA